MSSYPGPTQFVNILVYVKPSTILGKKWDVTTAPTSPIITQNDTIINYQIFDTSGHDIVFTGLTVDPVVNTQLSPAVLSVSRKTLTLSDANTQRIDFDINLNFEEVDVPNSGFTHDPQITNNPPS